MKDGQHRKDVTERIGRCHIIGAQSIAVDIDRACILNDDLSAVESFAVTDIVLLVEDSEKNGGTRVVRLQHGGATWLRDHLSAALLAFEQAEKSNGGPL